MRFLVPSVCVACLALTPAARAYVEAPYTLGRVCHEATHIVLVEVVKVNKEKNLIIYKKLEDVKGKHPQAEIKHNIGQRGFHPREWQNIMAWAEVGRRAVFFHNGSASETCIGTYWYQCYPEQDNWWGLVHAEPFLLRTFHGDVEKLAQAVKDMVAGKEVVVTCLADGNKEQLHQRKGKLQRLKASLKLLDYNAKRDFVGFGGDGEEVEEFKTTVLVAESSAGWKFLPAAEATAAGDRWRLPDFDDAKWRGGQAPVGYGEDEIAKRKGTTVAEKGVPFCFRRAFDVPAELLAQKGVTFRLCVASDDSAVAYLNGQLVDEDPVADHEFSYWNRDVELPLKHLKPGRNVLALLVKNHQGSSDIYLDAEVSAQVPLAKPKPVTKPADPVKAGPGVVRPLDNKPPTNLAVDKEKKTVAIACAVAPRKLPHLDQVYPIEVGATYPKGQKAHETVVTYTGVKPSDVHQALEELGLKPGKPARGENGKAEGPVVNIFLEVPGKDGKPRRLALEELLVDRKGGKPVPKLTWHFTGSAAKQPDPEKDDQIYGADLTGTLLTLVPVTDDTVFQTQLTLKDEQEMKLEVNKDVLPPEGTAVKLIIEVK